MNKRSCVGKIRWVHYNYEYTEDIADTICTIHHINMEKSFIQQQHDQNFLHLC